MPTAVDSIGATCRPWRGVGLPNLLLGGFGGAGTATLDLPDEAGGAALAPVDCSSGNWGSTFLNGDSSRGGTRSLDSIW